MLPKLSDTSALAPSARFVLLQEADKPADGLVGGKAEMRQRLDGVRRVPMSWKKSFAVLISHARPLAMSA